MRNKKRFTMKFKRGFINHVCIDKLLVKIDKLLVKIDKLLLKRDKNVKSESKKTMDPLLAKSNMRSTTLLAKSNMRKTMDPLLAKSNMRLSILNDMGVIILDPNTMKNNATASSSSPCPSSPEAMTPKSTYHGH